MNGLNGTDLISCYSLPPRLPKNQTQRSLRAHTPLETRHLRGRPVVHDGDGSKGVNEVNTQKAIADPSAMQTNVASRR